MGVNPLVGHTFVNITISSIIITIAITIAVINIISVVIIIFFIMVLTHDHGDRRYTVIACRMSCVPNNHCLHKSLQCNM